MLCVCVVCVCVVCVCVCVCACACVCVCVCVCVWCLKKHHIFIPDWDPYGVGVGLGLHSVWGGPLLDHFVTQLAGLALPVRSVVQDMHAYCSIL